MNSTFTHIPTKGMIISQAKLLDIQDSTFMRVSRQSIIVEKTKKVSVVNNEMTTDALKVVYAKDGSHLLISCNRRLRKPPSPECTWTTSTTTTVAPTSRQDAMDKMAVMGMGSGDQSGGDSF